MDFFFFFKRYVNQRRPTSYLIQIILFIDFREMQPISAGHDIHREVAALYIEINDRCIVSLKILLYLRIKLRNRTCNLSRIPSRESSTPVAIEFHEKRTLSE